MDFDECEPKPFFATDADFRLVFDLSELRLIRLGINLNFPRREETKILALWHLCSLRDISYSSVNCRVESHL